MGLLLEEGHSVLEVADQMVAFFDFSALWQLFDYIQHAYHAFFLHSQRSLEKCLILQRLFFSNLQFLSVFRILRLRLIVLVFNLLFNLVSEHFEFDVSTLLLGI